MWKRSLYWTWTQGQHPPDDPYTEAALCGRTAGK